MPADPLLTSQDIECDAVLLFRVKQSYVKRAKTRQQFQFGYSSVSYFINTIVSTHFHLRHNNTDPECKDTGLSHWPNSMQKRLYSTREQSGLLDKQDISNGIF